jgi:outer membrane receptor protein involved in Fe transport
VSTFDGTLGFNVGNAGSANVKGLEVEARYRVTDRFTFSGGLALTDFKFGEFFGQCYFGRPPDAPDGINCNYQGGTNEFVASWSGSVSTDWAVPLGKNFRLRWVVDVLFTDDYYLSPTLNPGAIQDGYVKINSRVAFGPTGGRWEVGLLGKNLTDEKTLSYSNETPLAGTTFGAPGFWGFVDPPKSFALQGVFRFR